MDIFSSLLSGHSLDQEAVAWVSSKINKTGVLCAFLYKKGFCGTFASSFQGKFVKLVQERDQGLAEFLRTPASYFPELKGVTDKKDKAEANRRILYEISVFRLMLKDPTLSFYGAWDLVAYEKEEDLVARTLFRPYSQVTLFRVGKVNYAYSVKKLAKEIKEQGKYEHLKPLYSLELALV